MNSTLILIQSLTADFKRIEKAYDDKDSGYLIDYLQEDFFAKVDLLKIICGICNKESYQPVFEGIEAVTIDEFVCFIPICINICKYIESQLKPSPVTVLVLPQSTEIN